MNRSLLTHGEQRYQDTRRAFDSVAGEYRGQLGNNWLVQQMREVLWRTVHSSIQPGDRLLDLGCGTGIDALHFAGNGHFVTAIDWSPEMVAETRRAAETAGLTHRLTAGNVGIHELSELTEEAFDCIYSDLGALNCVNDLEPVAQSCAGLLKRRGVLVCSVIGRLCPWELAYYGLRGNLARARIRFVRGQVPVNLNGGTVWTRYYHPSEFYRFFASHFELRACRALNLLLPPPYLIGLHERHPSLLNALAWLDNQVGAFPILNRAGDHFLLVMTPRS